MRLQQHPSPLCARALVRSTWSDTSTEAAASFKSASFASRVCVACAVQERSSLRTMHASPKAGTKCRVWGNVDVWMKVKRLRPQILLCLFTKSNWKRTSPATDYQRKEQHRASVLISLQTNTVWTKQIRVVRPTGAVGLMPIIWDPSTHAVVPPIQAEVCTFHCSFLFEVTTNLGRPVWVVPRHLRKLPATCKWALPHSVVSNNRVAGVWRRFRSQLPTVFFGESWRKKSTLRTVLYLFAKIVKSKTNLCLFLFIKISSSLQKPQQPKKIFKSIVTSQVILWRASGLKTSSQQGRAVLGHTNTPRALQPFASCCNCTVCTRRQQPDKHKTRLCFFATFNKGSVPGGDTWRTRPCLWFEATTTGCAGELQTTVLALSVSRRSLIAHTAWSASLAWGTGQKT